MVNFKILLRYRGNQQSANTITRQKTVFATSRLLRIMRWVLNPLFYQKIRGKRNVESCEADYLLGVVGQCVLRVLQHLPGHEGVEDGGPSQWHAEVEAKEPPVLDWFIKLLMKYDRGLQSVAAACPMVRHSADKNRVLNAETAWTSTRACHESVRLSLEE